MGRLFDVAQEISAVEQGTSNNKCTAVAYRLKERRWRRPSSRPLMSILEYEYRMASKICILEKQINEQTVYARNSCAYMNCE